MACEVENAMTDTTKLPRIDEYALNAQHGQNRTGVTVEADREFDDFDAALPIESWRADDCMFDEGEEIRKRARDRGYVVDDKGELEES